MGCRDGPVARTCRPFIDGDIVHSSWYRVLRPVQIVSRCFPGLTSPGCSLKTQGIERTLDCRCHGWRTGPIQSGELIPFFANLLSKYDAAKYAPILALNSTAQFDDTETAQRIKEDYNLTLGHLYKTEHAAKISKWTSTFARTAPARPMGSPALPHGQPYTTPDRPVLCQ
jgi:hypothetical protein